MKYILVSLVLLEFFLSCPFIMVTHGLIAGLGNVGAPIKWVKRRPTIKPTTEARKLNVSSPKQVRRTPSLKVILKDAFCALLIKFIFHSFVYNLTETDLIRSFEINECFPRKI